VAVRLAECDAIIYSLLTTSPAVGLVIGFIFGATNIIRFGPGPNGMMRTLGQYMVGSAATFGYAREHLIKEFHQGICAIMLTYMQILHVHRHNNPHRQLAHHDRSFRSGPRQPRSPSHHEEAVGAEEEADSRRVEVMV
jgi:hypothetical protein